ncbi:MAG: hypothetical protein ABSD73_07340 [Candidatus Bathyarchaeia archaeon]|jgi:hypothetical protein
MRNSKGNSLRTGLLAILLVTVFAPALVHAKDYKVGVKAGDWVKYGQITITWAGNGTEPSYITDEKKMDWARIDVLSVGGTAVSLNLTTHFNNGTQTFQSSDVDVQSGGGMGMTTLVASNLTMGDALSPQIPGTTINQTLTRMYAGANRKVNMLDSKNNYPGYPSEERIYWDQDTGIMVELYINQSDFSNPGAFVEQSIIATETNLWSANALDLIQDNLVYIIAGIAVIIVIVAATIAIRRRKPPSSQQVLPPPPSAPPPTPP